MVSVFLAYGKIVLQDIIDSIAEEAQIERDRVAKELIQSSLQQAAFTSAEGRAMRDQHDGHDVGHRQIFCFG